MACPSSTICRTTTDSASKISSYYSNTSMLLFSSTISSKRQRFITCSLDPISTSSTTSSSSSGCSWSSTSQKGNITNKKSLEIQRTKDGTFSVIHSDDRKPSDQKKIKNSNKDETKKSGPRKRRPLWQKVFFASKKMRSIILLNFITIVYASDIPVIKEVEAIMDPAAFSAVRFVMSAIPFLPFVFRSRDDVHTRNAGMELGFWISLGYLLEALGLLTSDAGRASFISLFTVIVVPLLDGMLGAIIPTRTWFGVLMSALGVAMLECSGSPPNVGDLLNFLSAIFFGIHMLRTEHISRSTKKENFLAILGYEVCVVALLSTIWVFIGGWLDGARYSNQSSWLWTWTELWDWIVAFPWIPALYTGAFSTGLCLWIEIAAMRDVSATETAIIYGMEPLWGAGFAWFLLGERWGTLGWIGATLVLGGSLVVQIFGSSPPQEFTVAEDGNEKGDLRRLPMEHKLKNGLSTSPIVVRSKKDVSDFFK
ncbi:uncharacterized protein Pyn_28881 [Prunus yedoensis var. nudiflora]|uniref:EamA domain-containing protein n=1 Tax=Prunus yedoensis var. nudiflora TaxID=2094558 RepID=A0A314ZE25_PRUYE|nr:uncharacterized protein Pyn_28881 [Prunus yedoensis var. nudiflora]